MAPEGPTVKAGDVLEETDDGLVLALPDDDVLVLVLPDVQATEMTGVAVVDPDHAPCAAQLPLQAGHAHVAVYCKLYVPPVPCWLKTGQSMSYEISPFDVHTVWYASPHVEYRALAAASDTPPVLPP